MYIEPEDIESSYQPNNLGKTLYDWVRYIKPHKVIEFGALNGYSTICIAKALRENGFGRIKVYDLFDKYKFKHAPLEKLVKNLTDYGVIDLVDIEEVNFFDWVKNPEDFDLLHLDISNTGDIIDLAWDKLRDKGQVIFEGGSKQRDRVGWMVTNLKKPINESKANYKVIDERFPSLSMFL